MRRKQIAALLTASLMITGAAGLAGGEMALAESTAETEAQETQEIYEDEDALAEAAPLEEAQAPETNASQAEDAVSEGESAQEQTAGEDSASSGKSKGDADGLIEDSGVVTSRRSGGVLEEELQKDLAQEKALFPGFRVDPWKYPPANITENTRRIYWYLREELELNHAAACGVLANIQMEANFRPIALGDGGTSYGICQWHLGRFMNLMSFCDLHHLDYNTLDGQLEYLKYELEHGYSHVYELLQNVKDTKEGSYLAAYFFCLRFEMPDQTEARSEQRGHLAEEEYFDREFDPLEEDETEADPGEIGEDQVGLKQLLPTELQTPEGVHLPGEESETLQEEQEEAPLALS